MGRTWESVVLTAIVGLLTVCWAQAQSVPFLADLGARASLALGYRAAPFSSGHADPNDASMTEAAELRKAAASERKFIVAYVVALESLLAAMAVLACLFVLALTGFIVEQHQRPPQTTLPAKNSAPFVLIPETKFRR